MRGAEHHGDSVRGAEACARPVQTNRKSLHWCIIPHWPCPHPTDASLISRVKRSKEEEEEPHLVERTKVRSMKLTWMENTVERKKENIQLWASEKAKRHQQAEQKGAITD